MSRNMLLVSWKNDLRLLSGRSAGKWEKRRGTAESENKTVIWMR